MRPSPATDACYMARLRAGACRRTALSLGVPRWGGSLTPLHEPRLPRAVTHHFGRMLRDSLRVPVGQWPTLSGGTHYRAGSTSRPSSAMSPRSGQNGRPTTTYSPGRSGAQSSTRPAIATLMNPAYRLRSGIPPTGTAPRGRHHMAPGARSNAHYNIEKTMSASSAIWSTRGAASV